MELWTGLAALKPDPNYKDFQLFKGRGAYVSVVAWASSRESFEEKVRNIATRDLNCMLIELEGIGLLEERMKTDNFPDELINMRATAYRQPADTVFGTFYSWSQDDAN